MSEARLVWVVKRDGQCERFDGRKLAGSMWRAMPTGEGRFLDVCDLAAAIEIYLARNGRTRVSSRAVFEMTLKVLRRAGFGDAAEGMECFAPCRAGGRLRLRVAHEGGRCTRLDKRWLIDQLQACWQISGATARIIAGQVEHDLLSCGRKEVTRRDVLQLLNARVSEFGLADAVPVRQ